MKLFDNDDGKYLLMVYWMSGTNKLSLKLSFGGS